MILGLISDTHGLLRRQALDALKGSDAIIHAGDVGRLEILDRLGQIAPVTAVRGNVDVAAEFDLLPENTTVDLSGSRIHVLHDVKAFQKGDRKIRIVISGHTHRHGQQTRDGILYINPGSAGPRRFNLPITVAKLDLAREPWTVQFIDLK